MKSVFILLVSALGLFACQQKPSPETASNTEQTYSFNNGTVVFDKDFEGGYFTRIDQIDSTTFQITSVAEDYPIDRSPTYAFKLITENPEKLIINLHFKGAQAPGTPKMSRDGKNWEVLPAHLEGSDLLMNVSTTADDTIILARHHLYTSSRLEAWMKGLEKDDRVHYSTCGKSLGGRDMHVLDVYKDNPDGKDVIVFITRQHPTEVPGQYVHQTYMETMLANAGDDFWDRYRIVSFPMLNPDAVDMGRWRHNLNGMDLNRHWVEDTEQPENKSVMNWLLENVGEGKMKFAIDFHSRDGDNAFYVTKRDLNIVNTYSDSIANRNPVLSYEVLSEFPSFTKIATPNYSNTWFNKKDVPILIHETTHDVAYDEAIETAEVSAKAFMGFVENL